MNIVILFICFVITSFSVFAQDRIVYETDNSGKILRGNYQELRKAVLSGADLRVGLGTETYNEVLFFQSLIITKESVIGVQPLHTSWHRDSPEITPYKVAIMISTDRKESFVRYNFDSYRLKLYPTRARGRYDYYRWFTDQGEWVEISNSDNIGIEEKSFAYSV